MIGRSLAAVTVGLSVLMCMTPKRVSAQHERCQLPLAEGENCSQLFPSALPSWYYNGTTGRCQPFVYKGCGGNANRFNTTDACLQACNGTSTSNVSTAATSGSQPGDSPATKSTSDAAGVPAADGTSTSTSGTTSGATKPSRTKRSVSSKTKRRSNHKNDEEEGEKADEEDRETEHEEEEMEEEEVPKKLSEKRRNKQSKQKNEDDEETDLEESEKHEDHEEHQTKEEKPVKSKSESRRRVVHRRGRLAARSSSTRRSGRRLSEKVSPKRKSTASGSGKKLSEGARSKLLDITMVSGVKSAVGDKAVRAAKHSSTLAELLKIGMEEGRRLAEREREEDDDDDDDDDIEIVGERIRTIILDPTYVFSYTNISADDMISLQEMAAQSEIATMQLIEKAANEIKNQTALEQKAIATLAADAGIAPAKAADAVQMVNEKASPPKEIVLTPVADDSKGEEKTHNKLDQKDVEGSSDKASSVE